MGNWSKIKLGNASKISKGQQLNKIDLEKTGDYPCINGGIEPSGYTDKWNIEANTITISEGGNSCGYVNFITSRFWSGGHCYSLLEIKENFDLAFLYHSLKGRESLIMRLRVGSGLPNIQKKAIQEFEFDYPEDKPEQTRIAEILSTADAAIEHTEKLIAKYQRVKTGLMQDLLTNGIDELGNIRSKATHKFVVKSGIEVPEEWEVWPIRQFAKITTGSSDTQDKVDDGVYPFFVRSQTIERSARYIFDGEGVLTSGDGVGVGKIYHYIIGKFDFHQRVYLIYDFIPSKVSGKYFFYFFRENFFDEVSRYSAKTTVDSVRLHMISDMQIPLPTHEEQLKIIEIFEKVEFLIEEESKQLSKLQSLKTGLMQDLLSGKVRVKIKTE